MNSAQRFALLALGRTWILLGSRKNPKPEKCLTRAAESPASSACFVSVLDVEQDSPLENLNPVFY